jgi:hypothetical protein
MIALRQREMQNALNRFANPKEAERFGLFSGAIWVAAIALFVLLTILVGILFSWLAIVAAIVGQMLLLAEFSKEDEVSTTQSRQ